MRVYFDICAIQRPFDDQTQLRIRAESEAVLDVLALCASGTLNLVASAIHSVENARNPFPDRSEHVDDVLALASTRVPTDPEVLRRASQYEASGIKRFDALHLSSAVEATAEFFCTTDDALLKRGRTVNTRGTAVVSPLELIVFLSEG